MAKKKKSSALDERQHRQIEKAAFHALRACILFDGVAMFYYFFSRQMEKTYPYAIQLMVLALVFVISLSRKGDAEVPHAAFGKKLDPSTGWNIFLKRLFWYALDAVLLILIWSLFTYYQNRSLGEDVLPTLVVSFLTVLILNIVIGEIRVRNWRKETEQMDREEDE